jgi:hypothetical protein
MKDLHKKYVKDLNTLAQKSGEGITSEAISTMQLLMKKSRGNPDRFLALLEEGKKIIVPKMVKAGQRHLIKARMLGRRFKNQKVAN